MAYLNENYSKLKAGYLFPEIARRVKAYEGRSVFYYVTQRETFRGYGPEQGYDFLRQAIAQHDFRDRGLDIADDEIFVSDGSKCDCGNILDIFGPGNRVAITDPVYPVYVDTNVMVGNTGDADESGAYAGVVYLPCTAENGFVPAIPKEPVDLIYLCYPNNPTGAVATREQLTAWVDYARKHKAIILFDAAYEAYVRTPGVPHSIYEIDGARDCAIEFRSFSKNGGFTGLRCAFTVVPKSLHGQTRGGESKPLYPLWLRNHTTKFNGVSYPVQRAAEAIYSPNGRQEVDALVDFYMENARILREAVSGAGLRVYGGIDAPYIWVRGPEGVPSWTMFDFLLREANIVTTPGSGFGAAGEGYFRISAFNSRERAIEAARRLAALDFTKAG